MQHIDPTSCRFETLIGALLYMMTLYQRVSCPKLARSIAAHLDCLAHHQDADATVREIANGMCGEWKRASTVCVPAAAGRLKQVVH